MSQSDRAIKKLATQLARIDREVKSWRGAQADYTSIENGGNFTFKDGDGNVTAIVGGQDDGSNTIRHVDGPVPPIPSGLAAHVDGPIVQVSWDGTFEDADEATYDWSHLEVVAVGPDNTNLRATINDVTGATANLAATASGEWTVAARSVSRAEKRSLDGDAGTVEVKLVDIDGAIEAVQDSANGKNQVHYSSTAPTPADPGIKDDTWFVGEVGRPNDIVEATNLAQNPSFTSMLNQIGAGDMSPSSGTAAIVTADWSESGTTAVKITPTASNNTTVIDGMLRDNPATAAQAGKTVTLAANLHLETPQAGSLWYNARRIVVRASVGGVLNSNYAQSNTPPNEAGTHRVSVTFTLPENIDFWYFMLVNGSPETPVYWDSMMIQDDSQASPYFDGDTPSGATDNESHYRWTGTPHASTSEKYLPALNIGDSDNWNVIEQYRHDGTGWVKVELSHYVFSSVDLGKATVGELDGIRIRGQSVRGEQLSGDAIDGKVITGSIIQSARDGQRWVGDTTGIRIFNADNDVRTQLSPDGSTFKGEVEADTLVVNDGAEFKSTNTLAQGAKFTLAAGVTDPTAPPIVQPYWDGIEFDYPVYGGQESTTDVTGLAFDGTNYWTVKKSGNWGDYPNGVFGNAVRINATTGATTGFAVPFTNSNERFGVTCIGSELFWLYRSGYEGRILVTDLNCVKKRETSWNLGYSKTNPLTYKPGIGNDGTNLVIAHCTDSGRLDFHTCNKTTGAIISTVNDSADLTRSDITGVYVGNADWGRKLVTVAKKSSGELPSFSPTSGVYDGVSTKFSAASPNSTGVVYVDGKFHTLDPSGVIHEYADVNTGDGSGDWWAAYYWYNWISLLLSNSSRISPPSRFTWPRRAKLKVMGAPLPVGVNRFALSLAKKATAPVRTDFHNVGSALRDGQAVAYLNALSAGWAAGSVPPDGNDFPEAESSVIESASGTFRVQGDGSGHWGPLTMGRNGVMSGLIVKGRVDITPDSANTAKQVTVNLPAGRFSKPPIVWAQLNTGVPHFCSLGVYQPSDTNSFDMFLVRTNTTTTGVYWFAMDSE